MSTKRFQLIPLICFVFAIITNNPHWNSRMEFQKKPNYYTESWANRVYRHRETVKLLSRRNCSRNNTKTYVRTANGCLLFANLSVRAAKNRIIRFKFDSERRLPPNGTAESISSSQRFTNRNDRTRVTSIRQFGENNTTTTIGNHD